MARVGRPSKLTIDLRDKICAELREGLFRRHAAALAGIDEVRLSEWYHRGARETSGNYHEFYRAVNEAEASFVKAANDTMKASLPKHPKMILALLGRRHPDLYGRRDNVDTKAPEDHAAEAKAVRDLLMDRLSRFLPEPAPTPVIEVAPQAPALPEAKPDAVG